MNLYQLDTPDGHPLAREWKTKNGYLREAKELARCLVHNRMLSGRDYPLQAVIGFTGRMAVDEHNTTWQNYTKNLRLRAVTALWVREPSTTHRIHVHLLLVAPAELKAAEDALRSACPRDYRSRLRLHIKAVQDQFGICYYLPKARKSGIDPVSGKYSPDRWASKWLYFSPEITLDKYGNIGPFWSKPKEMIWSEIKELEKGMRQHKGEVYEEARHLHRLTGMPLRKVVRSLAYFRWREASRGS